mmetsp:Transcript_100783/g.285694  ORF Transcript_100783/g.285694 Transcript_100783/m.285694 type:complete len:370 (+) Transcript_100783:1264-2373(+)
MAFQGLHQVLDHVRVETAAHHCVATEEQVGLRAEGVDNARHLHRDVAGTHHGDLLGLVLELEEPVAADRVLDPRDVGDRRDTAARDHDPLRRGGPRAAVAPLDPHGRGVHERRRPGDLLDAHALPAARVDALEPLHVGVPALLQRAPVEPPGRLGDVEAVALGGLRLAGHHLPVRGGHEHDLLGHAADVDARPPRAGADAHALLVPERALLDEQRFRPIARRPLGEAAAATAATNHDDVVLAGLGRPLQAPSAGACWGLLTAAGAIARGRRVAVASAAVHACWCALLLPRLLRALRPLLPCRLHCRTLHRRLHDSGPHCLCCCGRLPTGRGKHGREGSLRMNRRASEHHGLPWPRRTTARGGAAHIIWT